MIREYIAYYNFSRLQRRLSVHMPIEVYIQCRIAWQNLTFYFTVYLTGHFILSRGWDGGLWPPYQSGPSDHGGPRPSRFTRPRFFFLGLEAPPAFGLILQGGHFSLTTLPFSAGPFSSGAGVGNCSISDDSFFSTFAHAFTLRSAISFSTWSAKTFTSSGPPAGAS